MRSILHILTQPVDSLAAEIIQGHEKMSGIKVVVADLTEPSPDYRELLKKIFAADSVQTW